VFVSMSLHSGVEVGQLWVDRWLDLQKRCIARDHLVGSLDSHGERRAQECAKGSMLTEMSPTYVEVSKRC
jgi:hypothetical protein